MGENIQILFGMLGGLAMFLYGMNMMSDALQKTAGDRMKKILGFLTQNAIVGALAGTLVTAILQSSSATTVMVIGFISAGLMTLPQGISVIFGANIGTTMTAQLLAFKISDYIYPIIFIGFMMYFLGRKEKVRNIGLVIFSFGLLFKGIDVMGEAMKPLATSPFFIDLMDKVKDIPVLGIALGAGMTLIVQSSSATIAVLQSFASQPGPDGISSIIGLTGAIPILLGDNIGTTITAILASIGQSRDAKRAAIAHSLFNISGAMVFSLIVPQYAAFIRKISPVGPETAVISRQIANAHTMFNVICTLIWLPLIPVMVMIVKRLIPDRAGEPVRETDKPVFLDESMLGQPSVSLYLAAKEVKASTERIVTLLNYAEAELMHSNEKVRTEFDHCFRSTDHINKATEDYMADLFARGGLTQAQSEQAAGILFVVNGMDRVTGRIKDIIDQFRDIRGRDQHVSEDAKKELEQCFEIAREFLTRSVKAVRDGDAALGREVSQSQPKMHKAQKAFNKAHLQRVESGLCDASLTVNYSAVLYDFDRIVDNCVAIAEEAMDDVSFRDVAMDQQ